MASLLIDNYLRVPTKKSGNFFRLWVGFLKPYHDLTDRESEVLACLLKSRYQLSKDISNEEILDQHLFSEQVKKQIYTELNITADNFHVLFSRLKKKKVILEDKLNKRFIPALKEGNKEFKMVVSFDFEND